MAKSAAPAALRADPDRYPNLRSNPALERALRIRQELDKGRPREEAVRLAEQAMGPRAPVMMRTQADAKPGRKAAAGKRPARKASPAAKAATKRGRAAA